MKGTRLRYSEPLLREAVRHFVFRSIRRGLGLRFVVVLALVAAATVYLIVHGDRSWFVGVIGSLFAFVGLFFAIIYVAHFRNTVGRFRQMRVPEATLSCSEDQFTLKSELGSATMPWSSITEVWRHPHFWLIIFSPSQFSTLPLDCLDDEARAFITRKTQR